MQKEAKAGEASTEPCPSNMNRKRKRRRVQTCMTHLFLGVSLKLTKNKRIYVYSCSRRVLRWFNNLPNQTVSQRLAQQESMDTGEHQ